MIPPLSTEVKNSLGEVAPLSQYLTGSPVALVFLRHLGCTFCREHVRALRPVPVNQVIFVTTADPVTTEKFRHWITSPHRFLCDESAQLFEAFGVLRGDMGQLFSPAVVARGILAFAQGNINGRPAGDPMRLGGTFVFDAEGTLRWTHLAKDASDNASPDEIVRQLEKATNAVQESNQANRSPAGPPATVSG